MNRRERSFLESLHDLKLLLGQKKIEGQLLTRDALSRLVGLLGDPYVGEEEARLAFSEYEGTAALGEPMSEPESAYHAAVGLFCFVWAAEEFAARGNNPVDAKSELDEANRYLRDSAVLQLVFRLYEVPQEYQVDLPEMIRLHRTGTTSFILVAARGRDSYVLKIIKPRFMGNPTIEGATRAYASDFVGINGHYAPAIRHADRDLLVMDFVDGITLAEYAEREIWGCKQDERERLHRTSSIALGIITALKHFAENGLNHLDLSPENVIVLPEAQRVVLIDFGVNYVLKAGVSPRGDLGHFLTYMAPEVRSEGRGTERSDIYSLGMIILELLYGRRIGPKDTAQAFDLSYERHEMLAKLLEEMTSGAARLRLAEETDSRGVYVALERRLSLEIDHATRAAVSRPFLQRMYSVMPFDVPAFLDAVRDFDWRVLLGDRKDRESEYLAAWRVLNVLATGTSVVWAVLWFIHPPVQAFKDGYGTVVSAFVVAVTTMLVVGKYYDGVFGYVTARNISPATNIMTRMTAFGAPLLLPIFFRIGNKQLYPYWGLLVVPTTMLVILNNLACYRLASRIANDGGVAADMGEEALLNMGSNLRREFRSWWWLMALFLVAVLFVGTGVLYGRSRWSNVGWYSTLLPSDELVYASAIATINIGKMYFLNCSGPTAVRVRSHLARMFWAMERVKSQR